MPDFDIDNEPTVLVLGAGASHPYGFPLSPDLKKLILDDSDKTLLGCLKAKGHDEAIINRFKDALRYGDYGTIDLFLEQKSSFREIGAYFIAHAVAQKEAHAILFKKTNWYTQLYRILGLDAAGEGMPPLAVVTLNYDRSLEHFLTQYLEYNCPDRVIHDCRRKRQGIRIVHAHGSLGTYEAVPYGEAGKSAASLDAAAQSIKIVSDSMETAPDFMAAETLIGQARNVVFLGFSYNKTTLERLLRRVKIPSVRFFGTAYKLPSELKSPVVQMLGDRLQLGDENMDALGFLKWVGLVK
jgi:hypothetical protein